MARSDLTRAAEILAGKGGTRPLFQGREWNSGTERNTSVVASEKAAPILDSLVPRTDGTEWNKVSCSAVPPPLGVERGTPGTANDVRTAAGGCSECTHVTRYGNCGEPVAAGLVEYFGLVRHPDDGRGCVAFAARGGEPAGDPRAYAHFSIEGPHLVRSVTDLERRLALLLAAGAIDEAEAELVRERFDVHSAQEWLTLLDWCEAAVQDGAPACVPTQQPGAERSLFD